MFPKVLFLTAIMALCAPLWAQTENTEALAEGEAGPAASLEAVAFLVGYWQGEGMDGFNEELWGEAMGGSMMGAFRHLRDGEAVLSEHMQIAEVGRSLVLRLKHFNPDLTAWEEKDETVDFPLVRIEPGEAAYFNGLTYRRVADDELHVFLAMQTTAGHREISIRLRRIGR